MTRRKDEIDDMTREIIEQTGTCYPSVNQIAKYRGTRNEQIKALMYPVRHYGSGKGQGSAIRYRAKDVAERIYDSGEYYG